ncbi:LysR substrate-binding domain-containing protein [Pseudoxanthomonas sp.]|uniref:LysR substrate-binding domain-containing protein n=1 Tax=Pseudoxanthomonas sp. TaxID=1871049 RepID=UPI002613525A|nr:LysR substrate-binding domain-containing protein [Pseudoxanthomonas sp.]WDS36534.1 MAG: LysR substrate-binding domain-containing protein [Pseudoxanthomonas sp.]
MNFQQLKAVSEAIGHRFNLTETADVLHTSQSAVSRQIRELEEELGVEIFLRHGKRLTGLTAPGQEIARIVERMLQDRESLRHASEDFRRPARGTLSIAATHAQVRYRLPDAVLRFRDAFPQVSLTLQQTAPPQIVELLRGGQVDIGLVPEGLPYVPELVRFPAYSWSHVFVVPRGHPLLDMPYPALADIARFPLITFEEGMVGRMRINQAFAMQGLKPDIIISAADSDVIKTYVELGLGVGIIAERSYDATLDPQLVALETSTLIAPITTSVAVRRGTYLRGYTLAFIQGMVPGLTLEQIRAQVEDLETAQVA